ncbi:ABC transporter ATP-binding protein [Lacticaseibacillus sp. 866-1]|uniref:ABC transporter ATP-binding protein n=1 Tax=Lacticaseibacillus sp. 866-1 TaxID=2799576 RepID=UPI00194138BB|nr:ABC transporter ATP-binding protein [Lacticaseibacillus sp. 866-1]
MRKKPTESLMHWYRQEAKPMRFTGQMIMILLCQLATTLLAAAIPAWLVQALVAHTIINHFVLLLVGLIGAQTLIGWVLPVTNAMLLIRQMLVRTLMIVSAQQDYIEGPYERVLEPEYREHRQRLIAYAIYGDDAAGSKVIVQESALLNAAAILIMLSVTLAYYVWWIPVVAIAAAWGANALMQGYRRYIRAQRAQTEQMWNQQSYISNSAYEEKNGKDIRLYHMGPWYQHRYHALMQQELQFRKQLGHRELLAKLGGTWLNAVRDLLIYGGLIYILFNGHVSLAVFTLLFGLVGQIGQQMTALLTNWSEWQVSKRDLSEFAEQAMPPEKVAEQPVPGLTPPYTIRFDHVTYTYPHAKKPVLKDLNFTIPAGQKVALVGLNGAGKTTLTMLLMGLLKPEKGTIYLNEVPIQTVPDLQLRAQFAPVFQNALLFARTLQENIEMDLPHDAKRLQHALALSGLADTVAQLPHGVATQLTDKLHKDGVNLSGGQQQKLMVARALYRDAPILILDEPTAALDAIAEREQYQAYQAMATGKTSIFISHRMASTKFADKIFLLQDGQINEAGTHAELMAQNGAYAKLCQVQSQYYQKEVTHDEEIF